MRTFPRGNVRTVRTFPRENVRTFHVSCFAFVLFYIGGYRSQNMTMAMAMMSVFSLGAVQEGRCQESHKAAVAETAMGGNRLG